MSPISQEGWPPTQSHKLGCSDVRIVLLQPIVNEDTVLVNHNVNDKHSQPYMAIMFHDSHIFLNLPNVWVIPDRGGSQWIKDLIAFFQIVPENEGCCEIHHPKESRICNGSIGVEGLTFSRMTHKYNKR